MAMRSRFHTSWLLLSTTMGLGCADAGADPSADSGSSGGTASSEGGTQVPCDMQGELDLEGTWAALARYSLRLQSQQGGVVTICPEDQVAPAQLLMLLEISSKDASLSVSATPCDLELPNVTAMVGACRPDQGNLLSVEIILPAQLTDALGSIPAVVADATRGASTSGASIALDRMRFTWGTRQDTLPSWQSERTGCGFSDFDVGRSPMCEPSCVERCEDVLDDDLDGYPGVTVHACGRTQDDIASKVACNAEDPTAPGVTLQGKIPMILRTELVLEGVAKSSCEAAGTFASHTTYAVVGADAYLTNAPVSVASALQSLPLFEGDSAASVWRMVRVDGAHGGPDWGLPQDDVVARCAVARSLRNALE